MVISTVIDVKRSGPGGRGIGVGAAAKTGFGFVINAASMTNPKTVEITINHPMIDLLDRKKAVPEYK
jgi:hypothetical protein